MRYTKIKFFNIYIYIYIRIKIIFFIEAYLKMFKKSNYGTLKINKQQTIHKIVNHIHYLSNNESLEAVSVKYNVPVKFFFRYF